MLLLIIGAITAIASGTSQKYNISEEFDVIKKKMNENDMKSKEAAIAKGPGFEITNDRFLFYKHHAELMYDLDNKDISIPSDRELLNELITSDLAVVQAKELGITVTHEEVNEYIAEQRLFLKAYDPKDPDQALIANLMENRIRITGLSEESFGRVIWCWINMRNQFISVNCMESC
ncbi:hypothetical protein EBB07_08720 [Paenibacillaceae bacterium]|nr:hypothetical protein EBB07_08720 [Paenibacillaceae bacterium]